MGSLLAKFGLGILAGAGLVAFGFFVIPILALFVLFAPFLL